MGISGVLPGGSAPGNFAAAVTKSDTVDILPGPSRWLWVGGAGTLSVIMAGDITNTPVTFLAVPVGRIDLRVKRLMSAVTTATNVVAVF